MKLIAVLGLGALLLTTGCHTFGWPGSRAVYGDEILQKLEAKEAAELVTDLPPAPPVPAAEAVVGG